MRWEVEPLQQGLLYQAKVWPIEDEGPRTQVFSTKYEALAWVQGFTLCPLAAELSKLDELDWDDLISFIQRVGVGPNASKLVTILGNVRNIMKGVK